MELPDPEPGSVVRTWLDVTDLPTGGAERLPVVVVQGGEPGPTAWVTGGVHGDEVTGVAAAQDAARAFAPSPGPTGAASAEQVDGPTASPPDLADAVAGVVSPDRLRGRLVCVPVVSPAGLRRTSRVSYYHDEDPNRSFPDPASSPSTGRTVQELVASRLYDALGEADLLLDLHTAQAHSTPFVIRHRVLYGTLRGRDDAESLAGSLDRLVDAFDLPVVTQYRADEYVDRGLHRSLVGAALNGAGVPAVTVELGGHSTVEPRKLAVGVAEVFRALVAFDMLAAVPEAVARAAPDLDDPVDFRTRRHRGPRADAAGVVRHRVATGTPFSQGDVLADVRSPTGEHRVSLSTDHDGYVLGHRTGAAVYENDAVAALAVRDETPLVAERP